MGEARRASVCEVKNQGTCATQEAFFSGNPAYMIDRIVPLGVIVYSAESE